MDGHDYTNQYTHANRSVYRNGYPYDDGNGYSPEGCASIFRDGRHPSFLIYSSEGLAKGY